MTRFRFPAPAAPSWPAALVLAAAPIPLGWPATLAAQTMVQSLVPGDADALAAQMRTLAANPQDLTALATAGELSLKLGDLSGAAALFARADKVDPRNGRVKAGMASILVRSERPGEALRFFDQAASYGWTVDHFAADRGLAYDLIGENERAQRDYRLMLRRGADDETIRRYALSLGIAGQRTEALQQLDPLVRRQDRAAWRAQAFVLAMGGDTAGAAKIATAMMPAAMNQGLGAFFQRLPTLSRTDRAFAVHFGEIYPTPERLADARLTPTLAPLTAEPTAPVQVAAATTQQPDRRSRREQERDRRRAEQEARRAARTQVAAAAPVVRMAPRREVVQPLPTGTARSAAPVATAAASPVATTPAAAAPLAMRENDVRVASTTVSPTRSTTAPVQIAARTPVLVTATSPAAVAPVQVAAPAAVTTAPLPAASVQVAAQPVVRASSAPMPVSSAPVAAPVQVAAQPATPTTTPASTAPTAVASAAPPAVAPVASSASTSRADEVLARIVASLSIPASELGVEPARPDPAPVPVPAAVERAPTSSAGKRVVAEAAAKEARDGAVRRVVAARVTGDAQADEPAPRTRAGRRAAAAQLALAETETPARTRTGRRGAATDEPTDTVPGRSKTRTGRGRAADAEADAPLDPRTKRAADRKAAADKKAAEEKKALADQAAADRKAARANPARIWVQVAGGANEGDLGKAWNGVKAKTPALAGKAGYSTRLRATNRVLTGPFKTDAEARAFVNQLSKQGVSAFSFTSDKGQEVTRLGGK